MTSKMMSPVIRNASVNNNWIKSVLLSDDYSAAEEMNERCLWFCALHFRLLDEYMYHSSQGARNNYRIVMLLKITSARFLLTVCLLHSLFIAERQDWLWPKSGHISSGSDLFWAPLVHVDPLWKKKGELSYCWGVVRKCNLSKPL